MENIDFIKGGIWPLQTYGWSGTQFGPSSDEASSGKSPTNKPPMVVTSQPPGAAARDDASWISAYGASHDCVLSLLDGTFIEESTSSQTITGIYKDAMPHLQDMSLLRDAKLESGDQVQQVQYMISKQTVAEAQAVAQTNNAGTESEIRSIGMRMPMMMAGWGKTVALRPTDPEPASDMNKRKNDAEHKVARETWKHGAVDLRWDERRGVWGGWNDLIADHESKNLGTLVFSTNSDAICGFPFLKGKLEDVWWVRRTDDKGGDLGDTEGQDDDFIQTGEICTHLEHKLFDKERNNAGPLSDVFTVDTSEIAGEATCGSETTNRGKIEIKTTTFFHLNDANHGEICFGNEASLLPDDLTGCMKFDGSQFVPTVEFDPCEHGPTANVIAVLLANDKSLSNELGSFAGDVSTIKLTGGITAAATTTVDVSSLAQSASTAIQGVADLALSSVNSSSDVFVGEINGAFIAIAAEINACLEEFGCSVNPPEVFGYTADSSTAPPVTGAATAKTDVAIADTLKLEGVPSAPELSEPQDPCEGPISA